jgi:uncharacterized RDD family membrane protein YckC
LIIFGLMIPDVILIAVILATGPKTVYESTSSEGVPSNFNGPAGSSILIAILLGITGYLAILMFLYGHLQGRKGATWGKKALGLLVVDEATGRPLGFWKGFGRFFVPFIINVFCSLFTLIDCLFPLWDAKKQAVHDKMFSSIVIRTK